MLDFPGLIFHVSQWFILKKLILYNFTWLRCKSPLRPASDRSFARVHGSERGTAFHLQLIANQVKLTAVYFIDRIDYPTKFH